MEKNVVSDCLGVVVILLNMQGKKYNTFFTEIHNQKVQLCLINQSS
jgi:hypothetical protein